MANVTITQLPQAAPITGSELVPVVQNGVTVQTTTGAIAAAPAPSQLQTFLTLNQEPTLPNSRYLSVGSGLGLTDGGAQSIYQINLTGAGLSLLTSPNGLQVKTGPNTVGAVQIAVGAGLGITNPDGTTGNPTISLAAGILSNLAATTGTGFLAVNGATVTPVSLQPVANQTAVYDAAAAAGVPAVGLADNPVVPGTASITVPTGTTAQRAAVPTAAMFRFNTTTGFFEGYDGATWHPFSVGGAAVTSFSANGTGLTPNTASTGVVTLGGVLNAASGGTGAASLTGYLYGNGTSPATASTTIPTTNLSGQITNAQLINPSLTINGSLVNLGSSTTVTAVTPNALAAGTGLSGGSFTGASAATFALANTTVTAGSYGNAANTTPFTVDAQGRLTAAASTPIAILSQQITDKGAANGVASLDASGTVPLSQLPPATTGVSSFNTRAGAVTLESADVTGALGFTPTANPMTTVGDLIVGGASGTATRLGIGASGQVLSVAGGTPAWTTPAAGGVSSFNTRTGAVTLAGSDVTGALGYTPANNSYTEGAAGTVARTISSRLTDLVSVVDFGADPTGVADSTSAFVNAASNGIPYLVPAGTYNIASVLDTGNTPLIALNATLNASTGSVARSLIDLGQKAIFRQTNRASTEYTSTPTSYTYIENLTSFNIEHVNAAGYQQGFTNDSGGRTSVPAIFINGGHSGYGDVPGVSAHFSVSRHPSWASISGMWTGANSVVCFDGQNTAATPNVNIYGAEYHLADNGNDRVAANGLVLQFERNNGNASNSGQYNTVWTGVRVQTAGTYAADSAFSVNGLWNVGLDFSGATLTNSAAIALKTNDCIYFGVPATAPPIWYASSLSNNYITFNSSGIYSFVANGNSSFRIGSAAVVSSVPHTFQNGIVITSAGHIAPTVGAAGGASPLPSAPLTYWIVNFDGTNYKIPVYNS